MSWPATPPSNHNPGLSFPARQPRASRPPPGQPQLLIELPYNRKGISARRQKSVRKLRYGSGMLVGMLGFHWLKRTIKRIPVLGMLTSPILDLLPTVIVGPALGAALVYGLDKGDLLAARHVVKETAQQVKQEVEVLVDDVKAEFLDLQQHHEHIHEHVQRHIGPAFDEASKGIDAALNEVDRTVLPALQRQARETQTRIEQAQRNWPAQK